MDDQAIFGPIHDFQCACGKYQGPRLEKMICDICGVKVTSLGERRTRFAHIELRKAIPHPLDASQAMTVFPVLPAALIQSRTDFRLVHLYEELLDHVSTGEAASITDHIDVIFNCLLPAATLAIEQHQPDADVLVRAVALVTREP